MIFGLLEIVIKYYVSENTSDSLSTMIYSINLS